MVYCYEKHHKICYTGFKFNEESCYRCILISKELEAISFLLMLLGQIHHVHVESNHQITAINKIIKPVLARIEKNNNNSVAVLEIYI